MTSLLQLNNGTTQPPHSINNEFGTTGQQLSQQLYISIPIAFTLVVIYCIMRRVCSHKCELRRQDTSSLLPSRPDSHPQLSESFVVWMYEVWSMDTNRFYSFAGYDASVLRLFLLCCLKICLWFTPYSLFILLPLYATAEHASKDNDDWLNRISLKNVADMSELLYATVAGIYLLTAIALYFLSNVYLKIAYLTDIHSVHANAAVIKPIDSLSWRNFNQADNTTVHQPSRRPSVLHASLNAQHRMNDMVELQLATEEQQEHKHAPHASRTQPEQMQEQHSVAINIYCTPSAVASIPCIDRYTVMIRNIPTYLRSQAKFTQFMHEMFDGDKIRQIVMVPNVANMCAIHRKIESHQTALQTLADAHGSKVEELEARASNVPAVYGRIGCCGLWGTRVELVAHHQQHRNDAITTFNRLQSDVHQRPLTPTAFIIFHRLQDLTFFMSSPLTLEFVDVEISRAPSATQLIWENLKYEDRDLQKVNFFILFAMVWTMIFWSIPLVAIQGLANLEVLFASFNGNVHEFIPDPSTLAYVQGSLSVLVLDLFLMTVPFIMNMLSKVQRPSHRGKLELLTLDKYYYSLIFMVLLVTVISSTILNGAYDYQDYARNLSKNIGNIASLLASGLSSMSNYFTLYVVLNTCIWLPLELYLPWLYAVFGKMFKMQDVFAYSVKFPGVLLMFTIVLTYSVMNPVLCIFGFFYFFVACIVFSYHLCVSWRVEFEIGPDLWLTVFQGVRYGFLIAIATNYGLLLLKQAYARSALLIPLLLFVWVYTRKMARKFEKIFQTSSLIAARTTDMAVHEMRSNPNRQEKVKQVDEAAMFLPSVMTVQYEENQSYYQAQH